MSNLYAIGDIHGQRGMLDMLIEKVPLEKDDEIVFIGDYIDRGPDSRGVVDAVLEFKLNYPNTTCLRGNHEDMFLDYIKDEKKYPKGIFTMNGGIETLHSYGIDPRVGPPKVPPLHMDFFESLGYRHESGGFLFVHAGVQPGVPLDAQVDKDLIWIRDEFIHSDEDFGKPIVFGHTPMPGVMDELPFKLGIDTGAAYGGWLTCVQLEYDRLVESWQVHTSEVMA
ncbi:MAG: serine/threonine protein phosphatase [Nitrospinaceae bacterium]|jgi:serine/threonine protein phosphatase 1|nr:serine/threonine protein phosphatase [Nitrospinaceae bacterium]MBT3434706.1 serine/threonine protein phosphatase [Nitrospinaceae bacterium]MBT3821306.1 serine/threonine protein phosphatase [Nitrospinaceae bacterium]MBT4095723.1 serine/threonine protein phosphatase [Nitrospinaceae bacterium]MBT4431438.1 serine/threonine protein phosphatase [Nitrospinaceae bacterium]